MDVNDVLDGDQGAKSHHKQADFCFTRPDYRATGNETAVKVYTVSQESSFLLVQNVPTLGLSKALAQLFGNFSTLQRFEKLQNYPCEEFCEAYLLKYSSLPSARYAKKKHDNAVFYNSKLHVCYAPEYESVLETRDKLITRQKIVAAKLRNPNSSKRKITRKPAQLIGKQPKQEETEPTIGPTASFKKSDFHSTWSGPKSKQFIPCNPEVVHRLLPDPSITPPQTLITPQSVLFAAPRQVKSKTVPKLKNLLMTDPGITPVRLTPVKPEGSKASGDSSSFAKSSASIETKLAEIAKTGARAPKRRRRI